MKSLLVILMLVVAPVAYAQSENLSCTRVDGRSGLQTEGPLAQNNGEQVKLMILTGTFNSLDNKLMVSMCTKTSELSAAAIESGLDFYNCSPKFVGDGVTPEMAFAVNSDASEIRLLQSSKASEASPGEIASRLAKFVCQPE